MPLPRKRGPSASSSVPQEHRAVETETQAAQRCSVEGQRAKIGAGIRRADAADVAGPLRAAGGCDRSDRVRMALASTKALQVPAVSAAEVRDRLCPGPPTWANWRAAEDVLLREASGAAYRRVVSREDCGRATGNPFLCPPPPGRRSHPAEGAPALLSVRWYLDADTAGRRSRARCHQPRRSSSSFRRCDSMPSVTTIQLGEEARCSGLWAA